MRNVAFMVVLSLYPICAVANSETTQAESKLAAATTDPAATSPIASDPPSCSFQAPCIEDPATGKRYQFDAAGRMMVIE